MHYYNRNLGDYAKDAGHLGMLQHGAYTLLLDWHYATERAIPEDREDAYRIVRAGTDEEKQAVDSVLNEFFTLKKRGYVQARAMREISDYRGISSQNSANARKGWIKRHATALPSHSERNANQEPITNNHKPINTTTKACRQETAGDPQELLKIWQSERGTLPPVRSFTNQRLSKCRIRLSAKSFSLEDFREAVRRAAITPFLRGDNDRGWKAGFDWLIANDTNYQAVLEGKYDGGGNGRNGKAGGHSGALPAEAGKQYPEPLRLSDS